jgi:hypothetical protein
MWEVIDFNNLSDFLIITSNMIPIVSNSDKKVRYSKQYKENLELSPRRGCTNASPAGLEIQKETFLKCYPSP